MRIAIISTKPASLSSGTEVRIFHLNEGLKKKFKVDFIMPQITNSFNFFTRLKNLLQGKIPYFEYVKTATLTKEEIEQIKKADLIQVEELESFYAIEKYLEIFNKTIVLDAHNIEYKKFLAGTETETYFIKWLGRILAPKVKKLEIEVLKKIDYILTCSEEEKNYFSQYVNATRICCIPNGVTNLKIAAKGNHEANLLFMGLLSYGPNAQGLRYYLDKIHPVVKSSLPQSTITIIGRNPPEWLKKLARIDRNIVVKGFVDSVYAELVETSVCICPIHYGSGTRLKILEYMAAGKPVVSTTVGAEGIHATHGKEIIIADDPAGFARSIVELILDKEKAHKIGTSAKAFAEKHYNWASITEKLNNYYMSKLKINENITS